MSHDKELDNKLDKATELVNYLNCLNSTINEMSCLSMSQNKNNNERLSELFKKQNNVDKQLETILFDEEKKNLLIQVPKDNITLTKYVQDTFKYYNDS
jgi:hypothetical protein